MDWLSRNWFFLLFALLFVGMHLGHGGHGGHGTTRPRDDEGDESARASDDATGRTGHHH